MLGLAEAGRLSNMHSVRGVSSPTLPALLEPALPPRAGIGLKLQHAPDLLAGSPVVGFLEIHAENYLGRGGTPHQLLSALRGKYGLSIHGVGLSIGGHGPLDPMHLSRVAALVDRYEPQSFSEHLAWSSHDGSFWNDLLPVRYDDATLERVCDHIDEIQGRLRRRILLENPSTYLEFLTSTFEEVDFITAVSQRTGCGLLLDVNNVEVSSTNHGRDPLAYLSRFPLNAVAELHLGGHTIDEGPDGSRLLIDSHSSPTSASVWDLFEHVISRTGPLPTLIEWDNDVPPVATLLAEAAETDRRLAHRRRAGSRAS